MSPGTARISVQLAARRRGWRDLSEVTWPFRNPTVINKPNLGFLLIFLRMSLKKIFFFFYSCQWGKPSTLEHCRWEGELITFLRAEFLKNAHTVSETSPLGVYPEEVIGERHPGWRRSAQHCCWQENTGNNLNINSRRLVMKFSSIRALEDEAAVKNCVLIPSPTTPTPFLLPSTLFFFFWVPAVLQTLSI